MGKPTGFMDYERTEPDRASIGTHQTFSMSSIRLLAKKNRNFRAHAVWRAEFRSVVWKPACRNGQWMSTAQPCARVE